MNKIKNTLVTIITPTYNRASYLDETITSVLSQNYSKIEYIVIDDGSTDNSQHILNKYRDKNNPWCIIQTWEKPLRLTKELKWQKARLSVL